MFSRILKSIGICRYRGWRISFSQNAPVTGRWSAFKYGINMCNTTEDGLKEMIDNNLHDKWHATAHLPQ